MKKIIVIASTALLLTGCGAMQESFSSQSSFEIDLKDGRTVQCVQTTGQGGSVAVACDFDNAQ